MWARVARFILRNRFLVVILIAILSLFMGYHAQKADITYETPKLLPATDPTMIVYTKFRELFGQDGTVMVVGVADEDVYTLDGFTKWHDLGNEIEKIEGIKDVVSIARLHNLIANDSLSVFENKAIVSQRPRTQAEVDSIVDVVHNLPVYKDFIYNDETHSTLMAISFDKGVVNSKARFGVVDDIVEKTTLFANEAKVEIHHSGMPYIRTFVARKIQYETSFFMFLAICVTGVILYLFFRSFLPVVFSLLVIIVGVVWSIGILVLSGYHISVLTGLIPPLLIVIGVPNCIMLLNKYHTEYSSYGNKIRALARSIERVGVSLFLANITTAIGFAVFCSTHNQLLFEFGFVASISVLVTYLISLMLVPIVFSFLPPPSGKHVQHLENKRISKLLDRVDYWVVNYRKRIYTMTILIVLISCVGIAKLVPLGYVVDDLPKKDPILVDLRYFENKYNGILPFDIFIDTKEPNGVFENGGRLLYRIKKLNRLFDEYPEFARPISIVDGIKFANQALHGGEKRKFRLPGARGLQKIADFAGDDAQSKQGQFSAFLDSTNQYTRVSVQMKDIGSIRMKELAEELKPRVDTIFNYDYGTQDWAEEDMQYNVSFTGTSFVFLNGNDFLVSNLLGSVFLAVILISIVMYTMFMSPRMISVSVIPSLVPLIITAGLMGYFSIYLKPSTVLTFSIAFGIASDGTLYFLSKYRQEIKAGLSISDAVSVTIKETGVSMVYTAIILFCGFGIFAASNFGGTAALGILISGTLLVAYCSNLVLLPCFLLSLEKKVTDQEFLQTPLIDIEESEEDENEHEFDDIK